MRVRAFLRSLRPLKNFRRGFATNSSSSHSFVYLNEPNLHPGTVPDSIPDGDFRYDTLMEKLFYVLVGKIGGQWWALKDDPEKRRQYAVNAQQALGDDFPEFDVTVYERAAVTAADTLDGAYPSVQFARDPHSVIFGDEPLLGESPLLRKATRRHELDDSRIIDRDKDMIQGDDGPSPYLPDSN